MTVQIYIKSVDGIGGADTNSRKMADALISTGQFVECTKDEWKEAMKLADDYPDDEDDQ